MKGLRWVLLAVIVVLAGLFTYFNRGERTALHLGFGTFYQVPVATVVLVAFLLGMVAMFLLGLQQDLRIRRLLRSSELGRSYPAPAEEPDPY